MSVILKAKIEIEFHEEDGVIGLEIILPKLNGVRPCYSFPDDSVFADISEKLGNDLWEMYREDQEDKRTESSVLNYEMDKLEEMK